MTLAGLDRFIPNLLEWGATDAELVLHHGPADEAIARVHFLEEDWGAVSSRFLAAGLHVNLHAPLHPKFSLRRWRTDRGEIEAGYRPILAQGQAIAERQGGPCVLVVHAANERGEPAPFNRSSTLAFLNWASDLIATDYPGVRIAVELRHTTDPTSERIDTSRTNLVELIDACRSSAVGVCWDLGHDWENSAAEPGWEAIPSKEFLDRVIHVHAHDAGPTGLVHYPISSGKVPLPEMIGALVHADWSGSVTMELRYRFAAELGDPHEQMRRSYAALNAMIAG
jgi:sugar phosphate isomerase/epimerase